MAYCKIKGDTQWNTFMDKYKSTTNTQCHRLCRLLTCLCTSNGPKFPKASHIVLPSSSCSTNRTCMSSAKYQYTSLETTIWHRKGLNSNDIILFKVIKFIHVLNKFWIKTGYTCIWCKQYLYNKAIWYSNILSINHCLLVLDHQSEMYSKFSFFISLTFLHFFTQQEDLFISSATSPIFVHATDL